MIRIPPPREWRAPERLLIAANLVPVWGVLAAGWSAAALLWGYWLENLVVGLFAMLRMGLAPAAGAPPKAFVIPFFAVHYGMFCAAHGMFLGLIAGAGGGTAHGSGFGAAFATPGVGWLALALLVSHGASFLLSYLRGPERARTTVAAEAVRPYVRVVVMHLAVMLGGFALIFAGAPAIALLGLIALKTAADLAAHARAHENRAAA